MTRPAAMSLAMAAALCIVPIRASAQAPTLAATAPSAEAVVFSDNQPATRSGREIYARFREGLADPSCGPDTSQRWKRHFASAPKRLAAGNGDVLPLFGYVVDALREAHLPTEYALIPFVESGYKPGARSNSGPAGLWQFIALTARDHHVAIRPGYDGRLSPVDSTRAAVRYLKTLHGMFAGDWRLAVMAFNAGEYRVLGALKRSGQQAMHAQPDKLVGLSGITRAYVRKLRALSCVFDQADDSEEWLQALDRPVAVLAPSTLPAGVASLDAWARQQGLDARIVKRINPAFVNGRVSRNNGSLRVLAPLRPETAVVAAMDSAPAQAPVTTLADAAGIPADRIQAPAAPRAHTVERGDSIWRLAHRYGVSSRELLDRNDLGRDSVLHPGMVLKIDAAP